MSDAQVPTTPPSTREIDWNAQVRKAWGDEWHKPEIVYYFGNGRKFESTDRGTSGIYEAT